MVTARIIRTTAITIIIIIIIIIIKAHLQLANYISEIYNEILTHSMSTALGKVCGSYRKRKEKQKQECSEVAK